MNYLERDIILLASTKQIIGIDPEDVAQEIRLHIWNKLPLYLPKAKLRTWFYCVARRRIKDLMVSENARYKRELKYILSSPFIISDDKKENE